MGRRESHRTRVARFVTDLHDDERIYAGFVKETKLRDKSELDRKLAFLNHWRSVPIHPLVLYLLRAFEDGKVEKRDLVRALEYIESFLVRRLLGGIPPNDLRSRVLTIMSSFKIVGSAADTVR